MNLQEITACVKGTVEVDIPDATAKGAYASDLLSDVMGHAHESDALITIQNHLNTIAVCTLVGIEVVVICHARPIPDDMRQAAQREGVALISTPLNQFQTSLALSSLA